MTAPTLTPAAFAAKWRGVTTTEKAASQEHFIDLCPDAPRADPPSRNSSVDTTAIIAIRGEEMSQLIVRNVGQEIVRALKRRAARHGRSAEAEHREILQAALREDVERASFKVALASMPDVGADEDFDFERDLPRPSL